MTQNHSFPEDSVDGNSSIQQRLSFSSAELEAGYQQWVLEGMPDLWIVLEIRLNYDNEVEENIEPPENNG